MPGGSGSLTRLGWPQLSQKKGIHPIQDGGGQGGEKSKIRPWLIKGSRNLIGRNVVLYTQRIAHISNNLYNTRAEVNWGANSLFDAAQWMRKWKGLLKSIFPGSYLQWDYQNKDTGNQTDLWAVIVRSFDTCGKATKLSNKPFNSEAEVSNLKLSRG